MHCFCITAFYFYNTRDFLAVMGFFGIFVREVKLVCNKLLKKAKAEGNKLLNGIKAAAKLLANLWQWLLSSLQRRFLLLKVLIWIFYLFTWPGDGRPNWG